MTFSRCYRTWTMMVLVASSAFLSAASAFGDEPAEINYVYSTSSIVKSTAKHFDATTISGRHWPQPKMIWARSNFAAFLGYEDPVARTANKPALDFPWQELRKSAPNPRWRPLAPAEGSERPPVNGVALRFWDEGAARLYR